MGATIIVDNKPGASGMLAANLVAHAKPDGYTLLVTNSTPVLILPFMFDKVPYDVRRDLDFVTEISSGQLVLVTGPGIPARNVQEFLAWCRQNKGKVNYGSFGVGTSGHLTAAYLSLSRQLDMTHVPFKGELPMIQELVGGRLAWGFTTYAGAAPQVQAGRLHVLAAVADQRLKELPNVPTMAEAGLPDPEFRPMGWFGMMAPSGMPAPLMARLEKEARQAIRTEALQARIQAFGMDAIGNSSADFRQDYERMVPVVERMVKLSGAKME
jgi:tripartite-type tricarboxylate transporter receptor subunit TctC